MVAASGYDYPGCEPYKVTAYSPTGVIGCRVYGETTASWYHGSSAARNDCVWPWNACQPITITSLQTGRSITVTPAMYCGCYLGDSDASNDRGVDLTPQQVTDLGLSLSAGLYRVVIEKVAGERSDGRAPAMTPPPIQTLPDTAIKE